MQHCYHHNITFYHVMPYKILISHSKQLSLQFSTFEQFNLQIQHIIIKLRSLFQSHDNIHLNIKKEVDKLILGIDHILHQ